MSCPLGRFLLANIDGRALPAAVNIQLDLFLDSRAVILANEAIAALVARDVRLAAASLAMLRCEAPDYPHLSTLDALTEALLAWRQPASDAAAIVGAVRWLEQEVAPAATHALVRRRKHS